MIPKICANCSYGVNINSDSGIVRVICTCLPIDITKRPDDICGQFKMEDNPSVQIPEDADSEDEES